MRAGLYQALQSAFRAANISWAECEHEDRGDGALILAPANMTKGPFVEDLPAALVGALLEHNRTHRAEEQVRLRMALHAGEINYDDHGVTGSAINLAFRLLDAAALRTGLAESSGVLAIIVSSWFFDEVVRHSRRGNPADYQPVSVVVKETTATAWLHLPDRRPAGAPDPTGATEPDPRLRGRDQVLTRLQRAAHAARAGRFTLALVTGEPGIGKSALAQAIGRTLGAEGWTVAWGACPEREGSPAGQPWAAVLQGLAGRFPSPALAGELAPLLDDHATLHAADDVPAARFRLRSAVSHYLAAVVRAAPLLLVLDDLHHADGEALALLVHLAADLATMPALVLATYRPTEVDEQLADALASLARKEPEHVHLTGLDTEAVGDLMRELCARPIADDIVAAIARRTEGNPFFVREVARLLETDGEHAAIGDVPQSVRHIVRRRVARLSAPAQSALYHAAVIGRDFTLDVLAAVTGMGTDDLIECLDPALRAGLLVEPPHAATRSLRFAHSLVSDTLYHDISRLRRTGLHARVGAAMERLGPHDAVVLAHHWGAAQAPDAAAKAARYLRLAAEQAERRYAHREAAGLWQQAVLSYAHAPGATVRDRLELLIGAIRCLSTAGEHGAARGLRDDALAEVVGLRDAELTARVIVAYEAHGLWPHHAAGKNPEKLVELIDRTLRELPPLRRHLRCRLLAALAIELEQTDDVRGELASLEAVVLARQLGAPGFLATALNARFRRSYWTSTLAEREQIAAELFALGRDHGLVTIEATGRQALLRCACGRGDFARADEHAAETERLADTYDLPIAAATVSLYQGLRHTLAGRFGDAERAHQHAGELISRVGCADAEQGFFPIAPLTLGWWTGKLADLVDFCAAAYSRWPTTGTEAYALTLATAGRLDEAHAVAARRPPVPRDIRFKIVMALRGMVGLALHDHHRLAEAYQALRPMEDEIAGGDTGGFAVLFPVAQLLGDLADRLGQPQSASAHYLKAKEVAERADVPLWMAAAREALARTITRSKPYRAW
ncbi:MAG TPA: AAA family ATPase [Actinophytocola sp.]|uniref:ATP-binding protein n=1 Tax=Actinophytocola sp. TaxID=1872138 RepID=UPI002DBAF173|nr:AAA family ATPase [Actinophytocola sp.]HEU5474440.1 AAA family ATPase [Actinophytocola sp.]